MRNKILFPLLFVLAYHYANGQDLISSIQKEIVLKSVNVIPMDTERTLKNQTVVIYNGRIKAIGDDKKVKFSKAAMVIDAKGKYLIPGLAEMHAHVPPIDDLEPMKEALQLYLANGITNIRGMLGHPQHIELRSKIRSGEVLGPNFYSTGPSFNGISVKSPEAGTEMVRQQKAAGYDYLKLHPGLSREKFDAIAATAHEVGIPYAGHVSFGVGVWRAIESPYSSIDHLDGFIEGMVPGIEKMVEQQAGPFGAFVASQADLSKIPQLMQALKQYNVWVVPTQSLFERAFNPKADVDAIVKEDEMKYISESQMNGWLNGRKNWLSNPEFEKTDSDYFLELRRKLIYECQQNGVGLLLGSDAPQIFNVPGFAIHHELKYLVLSGLTPFEALQSGTVNVAKYLNRNDAGIIKPGNVAELVLLNANPLEDISATHQIEAVFMGKDYLSRKYLDAMLKTLEKK
jgi:imidazolonepropionase-like amidohydrolase